MEIQSRKIQDKRTNVLKTSKRRGRPKGSVKRRRSTLETSLTSHDEELFSIQSGVNYRSEIAEAFASSQNQIDDRVYSITTEYRQVEPECTISQLSPDLVLRILQPIFREKTAKRHQQMIPLQHFCMKVILMFVRP